MNSKVSIQIDAELYEMFRLALNISNDSEKQAVETSIQWYIANTFKNASQEYMPKPLSRSRDTGESQHGYKALARIPLWAMKPHQYNHKIVRAYFKAVDIAGTATIQMMEMLCSDKERPDLYVPTFKNNYAQMKIDGAKSHGKVFEDDGVNVWLWREIEDTLLKYKSDFYRSENENE